MELSQDQHGMAWRDGDGSPAVKTWLFLGSCFSLGVGSFEDRIATGKECGMTG